MGSLQTPETDVKRKGSLKQRLRGLSINRNGNKSAHFEEEGREEAREVSDPISPSIRSMKPRTNSASSGPRPLDLEPEVLQVRGRSQGRHNTVSSTASSISQAQLATPILSTPIITGSDHTNPSIGTTSTTFVPLIDPGTGSVQVATTEPSSPTSVGPAAGGFLNSVFNVATNIGSVLGAGPTKSSPARESIKSFPTEPFDNGSSALKKPTVGSLGLGDLSLRDMGIQEEKAPEQDVTPQARTDTGSDPTPPLNESEADITRLRSVSRATTRNRRRRGSTAVSVFGSDTNGQKITGFAVASNKRNREFHATFRSVPEGDYLLDGKASCFSETLNRLILFRLWLCIAKGDIGTWQDVCLRKPHLLQFQYFRMGHECKRAGCLCDWSLIILACHRLL